MSNRRNYLLGWVVWLVILITCFIIFKFEIYILVMIVKFLFFGI